MKTTLFSHLTALYGFRSKPISGLPMRQWRKEHENGSMTTEAGKQYAIAHAAHYKTKDLHEAFNLYRGVMDGRPDTREAEYSRSQINNIAKSVISRQALLDAEINLVLTHF